MMAEFRVFHLFHICPLNLHGEAILRKEMLRWVRAAPSRRPRALLALLLPSLLSMDNLGLFILVHPAYIPN